MTTPTEDPQKKELTPEEEEQSMATMTRERVAKRLDDRRQGKIDEAKKLLGEAKEDSAALDQIEAVSRQVRIDETTTLGKELGEKKEKELTPEQQAALISTLKTRFDKNEKLHKKIQWTDVERALKAKPEIMWSLSQLESTGGEPDVIGEVEGAFIFGDCSKESPEGRRNIVFDAEAEAWLRKNHPDVVFNGNALDRVIQWGVDIMDEEQYRALQKKLSVDGNTWSWLKTSSDIRKTGRSLYGGRRGDMVRVNETDAVNQYVDLGFRCALRVLKV